MAKPFSSGGDASPKPLFRWLYGSKSMPEGHAKSNIDRFEATLAEATTQTDDPLQVKQHAFHKIASDIRGQQLRYDNIIQHPNFLADSSSIPSQLQENIVLRQELANLCAEMDRKLVEERGRLEERDRRFEEERDRRMAERLAERLVERDQMWEARMQEMMAQFMTTDGQRVQFQALEPSLHDQIQTTESISQVKHQEGDPRADWHEYRDDFDPTQLGDP